MRITESPSSIASRRFEPEGNGLNCSKGSSSFAKSSSVSKGKPVEEVVYDVSSKSLSTFPVQFAIFERRNASTESNNA